jgi:hypothetical protein
MDKKQLIGYINKHYQGGLNHSNTAFSNINKAKEVWWFNIHVSKFAEDVNLLLNSTKQVYWVHLPKGFTKGNPFKIREDKNAVDLEISADRTYKFLKDVKSGGIGFDFSGFVKEQIGY